MASIVSTPKKEKNEVFEVEEQFEVVVKAASS